MKLLEMKKGMAAKIIAVIAVLTLLFSAVFSVPFSSFADGDVYGTEEDGIKGNATTVAATDSFKNGDFEEGLRYWGDVGNSSKGASNAASIKIEDENKYLEIDRTMPDGGNRKGVVSAPFKINGLSVGDEVAYYFDYKVEMYDSNTSGQKPLILNLKAKSGDTTFGKSTEFGSSAQTDILKWTRTSVSSTLTAVPTSGEATFYFWAYINWGPACKVSVDNIVVAIKDNTGEDKTPDGYWELLDGTLVTPMQLNPDMYGTMEDGLPGNVDSLTPIDTLYNGDFNEGLRFWGSYTNNSASAAATVKYDGENSYAEFVRRTDEKITEMRGLKSIPIKIKDIAVGDEIALYMDYKFEHYNPDYTGQKPVVAAIRPISSSVSFDSSIEVSSPAKLSVEKITRASASSTVAYVAENGEAIVQVSAYLNYNVAGKAYVDNIVVAVRHNSGENKTPDGYYELLDGTLVTPGDLNPNMYGTVEDGLSGNVTGLKPAPTFKNGDFSEGFRYWGSFNNTSPTAEGVIAKNGENSYLEITRANEGNLNSAKGLRSMPFNIENLAVGDEVFLYFDYKLEHYNADETGQQPLIMALTPNDGKSELEAGLSWGSPRKETISKVTRASASAVVKTVPEGGTASFEVRAYLNWNVAAKAYVDNIIIAVRHNSGNNITPDGYYELLDGTLVTELQLNPELFGTADGGISGTVSQMTPIDTFKNGDFSEGLKYWGSFTKDGVAGNNAEVVKEGNNQYIIVDRDTPENAPQGLASVPFKIAGLKEGDVIAYKFDFKTETYDNNIATRKFYVNLNALNKTDYAFKGGASTITLNDGSKLLQNETVKTPAGWSTIGGMSIIEKLPAGTDPVFYISFYLQYKAAGKVSFDNFEVYIKRNSGTDKTPDGYYETLDGELVSDKLFKGVFVTSGSSDIESGANDYNYPGLVYSWIGTEEEGIYSNKNDLLNNTPTRTSFMNSDFSKGLQYWFESSQDGYTSDKVTVRTEANGNKYISFSEDGTYTQVNQTCFWLTDAQPGDELYVMAKFRKNGNPRFQGYIHNMIEGSYANTRFNGDAKVLYEPESDDDWGVCISTGFITVGEQNQVDPTKVEKMGNHFRFYLMFSASTETHLDDITFVKKLSTGEYVDLKGNVINVPKNTNNLHYNTIDGFDWSQTTLKEGFGAANKQHSVTVETKKDVAEVLESDSINVVLICVIAAGFAILVSAGIIAFVIIKKRKTAK